MLRVGRGHGIAGLCAESGEGSWDSRSACGECGGVMGQQVCMLRVGRAHRTAGLRAENGEGLLQLLWSWDSRFVY